MHFFLLHVHTAIHMGDIESKCVTSTNISYGEFYTKHKHLFI